MNIINLEDTEDTPRVILDKDNGIFEISGRSLPEDAAEFYEPIIEWLTEYSKEANAATNFVVKLEYFNTASSKMLLDMMSTIEEIDNSSITWYFQEDDEDMEEAGEEFGELIDVPFELKPY